MPGTLLALAAPVAAPGDLDPAIVVGLVVFAVLAAVVVVLVQLQARLQRAGRRLEPLERLASIEATLKRLAEERERLDLRRLEHVLIDLRDGQKRLEERLIATLESLATREVELRAAAPPADAPRGGRLAERVTSRLLAMGFERIEVLTPTDELDRTADGDGEVLVEARRGGAPHKGRVLVRDGTIADVRLRDAYEAFP